MKINLAKPYHKRSYEKLQDGKAAGYEYLKFQTSHLYLVHKYPDEEDILSLKEILDIKTDQRGKSK